MIITIPNLFRVHHHYLLVQTRDKLAPGELEQEIPDLRDPDPVIVAQGRPASPSEEICCLTADPCKVNNTKKVLTLLPSFKILPPVCLLHGSPPRACLESISVAFVRKITSYPSKDVSLFDSLGESLLVKLPSKLNSH